MRCLPRLGSAPGLSDTLRRSGTTTPGCPPYHILSAMGGDCAKLASRPRDLRRGLGREKSNPKAFPSSSDTSQPCVASPRDLRRGLGREKSNPKALPSSSDTSQPCVGVSPYHILTAKGGDCAKLASWPRDLRRGLRREKSNPKALPSSSDSSRT